MAFALRDVVAGLGGEGEGEVEGIAGPACDGGEESEGADNGVFFVAEEGGQIEGVDLLKAFAMGPDPDGGGLAVENDVEGDEILFGVPEDGGLEFGVALGAAQVGLAAEAEEFLGLGRGIDEAGETEALVDDPALAATAADHGAFVVALEQGDAAAGHVDEAFVIALEVGLEGVDESGDAVFADLMPAAADGASGEAADGVAVLLKDGEAGVGDAWVEGVLDVDHGGLASVDVLALEIAQGLVDVGGFLGGQGQGCEQAGDGDGGEEMHTKGFIWAGFGSCLWRL